MRITIISPSSTNEYTGAMPSIVPVTLTLLAALTPEGHDINLLDMLNGDQIDYESDTDIVAITVRSPLAPMAYEIADNYLARGKKVFLGGPHMFVFPEDAKKHATAVAIGEGEEIWPAIVRDTERNNIKDYYVCGPYDVDRLNGTVFHIKKRPTLDKIPALRRDLLAEKKYYMDSMFTTRGCPNNCSFCSVTRSFGGKIRHRPIDDIIAEVNTLGKRYTNVDDSIFGHPQLTERPEENQYYLDLFRELAKLPIKRLWVGAGGLSAVNYKDGRKIIELAAESGLVSIAAGLESISGTGQKQSGSWRKLHYESKDAFNIQQMKDNIKFFQSLGIIVLGYFIIGWDEDTADTYWRTLEFCDETNIVPFIQHIDPIPGSQLFNDFLESGQITQNQIDNYNGGRIPFKHPTMSEKEMVNTLQEVLKSGYTMRRITKRMLNSLRYRFPVDVLTALFFLQLRLRKSYYYAH